MAAWPLCGLGAPKDNPGHPGCTGAAGPGAHVGSLRGWASHQELEGPGRKEGVPLCHPQPVPALLPAALFVPSLRGSPEISPSSWLLAVPPLPAPGRSAVAGGEARAVGLGCGARVGSAPSCAPLAVGALLLCWGVCVVGQRGSGACGHCCCLCPVGGSGSGAATPTPMPSVLPIPAFAPAALQTSPCGAGPARAQLGGAAGSREVPAAGGGAGLGAC